MTQAGRIRQSTRRGGTQPPLRGARPYLQYVGRGAFVTLALYVRQLFGHLPVADFEQVDAAHVARSPIEAPSHRRPIARHDHLLRLECRVRRVMEEAIPKLPHCLVTHDPLPVWRRQRVLEDAVVGHQRHHGVDVVPAERLVEGVDGFGGAGGHQPWPVILAITSARFGPPFPNGTECARCANTTSATPPTWVTFTCSALS